MTCVYMSGCVYVCIHVNACTQYMLHVYACLCTHIKYKWIFACVHACICMCACVCMCLHSAHIHINGYVCVHVCMCVEGCVSPYVCSIHLLFDMTHHYNQVLHLEIHHCLNLIHRLTHSQQK